jgi:hypothetical protein
MDITQMREAEPKIIPISDIKVMIVIKWNDRHEKMYLTANIMLNLISFSVVIPQIIFF